MSDVFFHVGLKLFFFLKRIRLHNNSSLRLSGSLPCCTNKHQSQFHLQTTQPDSNTHVIGASPAGYLPKHSFRRLWHSKWLLGSESLLTICFKKRIDCAFVGANLNNSVFTSSTDSISYSPYVYRSVHGASCNPRHGGRQSNSRHVPGT